MPSINKGESRDDYLKRCVPYVMKNEGLAQDAAVGKCEGMFTQHQKHHAEENSANGKQKVEIPRLGAL
jgi:hypothetical protein